MAMTAKGTCGSSVASATSITASPSRVRSRPTVRTSASPKTSRAAIPSRWRSFQRRSAARRRPVSDRQAAALVALTTSSSSGRVSRRSARASRATRSGLRASVSPSRRLVPRIWHSRRAASGDSRNASIRVLCRGLADSRLRSCSRPRSGSDEVDSQSSISGSSCCISRLTRLRPRVSSRTAAWVRQRVGEAERLQPGDGGLGAERAVGRRERLEQRAEVEPFVDRPRRQLLVPERRARTARPPHLPACRGSRAPARGGRWRARRRERCGSVARRPAGAGARPCAGTRRRRPAGRHRRCRRSRPGSSRRARRAWWASAARDRRDRARAAEAAP